MAPPRENPESGPLLDDRTRRLLARRYAWELLGRALEEREYRSSTMPWPPEEHLAVMEELERVRDTLYVVSVAES